MPLTLNVSIPQACLKDAHAEVQTRPTARRNSVYVKLWRLDGHTCAQHTCEPFMSCGYPELSTFAKKEGCRLYLFAPAVTLSNTCSYVPAKRDTSVEVPPISNPITCCDLTCLPSHCVVSA